MKLIKVYGCSKNPARKDLVRRAAVYFLNRLLPRKRKIMVNIHIENGLIKNNSVYGECYHVSKTPSKYKIRLDEVMGDIMLITTLAHEFVHVRQFDNNELSLTYDRSRWHSKYYSSSEFIDSEEPWEIEPCELESVLASEFFTQ